MCPLLRNGGMIVVSLVAVALSALSAMAFYPPAFRVGRVTAARAKTTVVVYADNANSKDKLISELKAENFNLKFKMISDKIDNVDCKIDRVDRKIDDVRAGLEDKFDNISKDLKDVKAGLEDKIEGLEDKIEGLEDKIEGLEDKIEEVKIGIVVIACLCAAPQLSSILALLKK
jgi:chaperonin cofactor prefoldin